MGTWGVGIFENDTALDFAESYGINCKMDIIDAILHKSMTDKYIDADTAMETLCAICIIMSFKNEYCQMRVGKKVKNCIMHDRDLNSLLVKSDKALKRIQSVQCELYDLWEECGELMQWQQVLNKLQSELGKTKV